MKYHTLLINLTSERLPVPDTVVLVEGGAARWNGKDWISEMHSGGGRVIEWEVTWWAILPHIPYTALQGYDKC